MWMQKEFSTMVAGGFLFVVVVAVLALASIGLWFCSVIHCISNRRDPDRLMWVLVVCFGGPIGATIYLFMGRSKTPPTLQSNARVRGGAPIQLPPLSGVASDHTAMQDERKRAQAI